MIGSSRALGEFLPPPQAGEPYLTGGGWLPIKHAAGGDTVGLLEKPAEVGGIAESPPKSHIGHRLTRSSPGQLAVAHIKAPLANRPADRGSGVGEQQVQRAHGN